MSEANAGEVHARPVDRDDSMLIVEKEHELLALHRALYEARFSTEPRDDEISGSTTLADLHKKVVDALIQIEAKRGQTNFAQWVAGDHSPEIALAKTRLQKISSNWRKLSAQDKRKYVSNLVSPFQISNEEMTELLGIADLATN